MVVPSSSPAKSSGASGKYRTYARGESSAGKTGSIGGVSTGGAGKGTPSGSGSSSVQKIGGSSGSQFVTTEGSVGYASGGVTEIKLGSKSSGVTFASEQSPVPVSLGVAKLSIAGRNEFTLRDDVQYSIMPQSRGKQAFERGALVQSVKPIQPTSQFNIGGGTKVNLISSTYGRVIGESNAFTRESVLYPSDRLGTSTRMGAVFTPAIISKGSLFSQGVSFVKGGLKSSIGFNPVGYNLLRDDSDIKTFQAPFKRVANNLFIPYSESAGNVFLSEFKNRPLEVNPLKTASRRLNLVKSNSPFFIGTGILATGILFPATTPFIEAGIIGQGIYTSFKGLKNQDLSEVLEGGFIAGTGGLLGKGKRIGVELIGKNIKELNVNSKDLLDITLFGNKKANVIKANTELVQSDLFGKKVTSKSIKESIAKFEAGRVFSQVERKSGSGFEIISASEIRNLPFKVPSQVEVVTVSPSFLKGPKFKSGPKGEAGIEDPIGFAGPKGEANLMFTGLKNTGALKSSELSFSVRDLFFRTEPTINRTFIKDFIEMPKSVRMEAGFGGPKQTAFWKSLEDTGIGALTKRSYVGKGEQPAQWFTPKKTIELRTRTMEAGKPFKESGTNEDELGLFGAFKRIRGGLREDFAYTIINQKEFFGYKIKFTGDLIRVPKYELLSLKELNLPKFETITSAKSNKQVKEIFVYHGTDWQSAQSIMKTGFKEGSYFTTSKTTAQDYAMGKEYDKSVVFKVKIPKADLFGNNVRNIKGGNKYQFNFPIPKEKIGIENAFESVETQSFFNKKDMKLIKSFESKDIKAFKTSSDLFPEQRNVLRQQSEFEVNLMEIKFGKVSSKQRELFVEKRYKLNVEEYLKSSKLETPKSLKASNELSISNYLSSKFSAKFRGNVFSVSDSLSSVKSLGSFSSSSLFSSKSLKSFGSSSFSSKSLLSSLSSGSSSTSGFSSFKSINSSKKSSSLSVLSGVKSINSSKFSSKSFATTTITSNFFKPSRKKGSKKGFFGSKLVSFSPKYVASVEASFFNIRGRGSSFASVSGLGIRKIGG